MCGISFYCSLESHQVKELNNSLAVTSHRGPDASGVFTDKIGTYYVGLGHNRLSIMDLSHTGSQPMVSSSSRVISYNGEIYNHEILKNKLLNLGYIFNGSSDTEVILSLFDEFGSASFGMLKGMFSFVILDTNNEQLFVVRDTVGIKPVYIYQENNNIYGCSEIKGLKEFNSVNTEVDPNDIYEFFNNGFLYEPSTGYKDIKKLMPGHYLQFNLITGKHETHCFKNIKEFQDDNCLSDKIKNAIQSQQIADVPLGIFFSGGADSSILASHFNSKELFFAKYAADPTADIDLKYSKLIADYLGKDLNVVELDSNVQDIDSLLESVDFVAANTEELISDYTFWATYQLSLAAKNNGYKVMLSGMGGDEAFAGYPRYIVLKNHNIIKLMSPIFKCMLKFGLFPKKLNKKFERLVSYCSEKEWGVAYSRMLGYFSQGELTSLFKNNKLLASNYYSKVNDILSKYQGDKTNKVKVAQFMDSTGFLSHNLMVSDKASMLASIELRVPLLDESIVAHGFESTSEQLIHKRETKFPLKSILKQTLPSKMVERPKTGFNPPLDGLIDKIGPERLKEELSNLGGFLNILVVTSLIDNHFSKVANNTYKLWQLLYFSRWIKINAK